MKHLESYAAIGILVIGLTTGAMAVAVTTHGIQSTRSQEAADRLELRRWKALCRGAGRYDAMREAYEAGKPDPCNPDAKEWRR